MFQKYQNILSILDVRMEVIPSTINIESSKVFTLSKPLNQTLHRFCSTLWLKNSNIIIIIISSPSFFLILLLGALYPLCPTRHIIILIICFLLLLLLLPPILLFHIDIMKCSFLTLVDLHVCQL